MSSLFPRGPLSMPELVAAALAEDVGPGDRTTQWTVPEEAAGRARVVAREAGVIAGTEPATETFRLVGPDTEVRWKRGEGETARAGDVVAVAEGRVSALLTAERTALNFLARLSGIASAAARYVEAVEGTGCRVTDTRKTAPGWRALEKAATAAGGAVNHRSGLHDMVLIKENHVRAAGGVRAALEAAVPRAREAGIPVEVEVGSLDELDAALAGAPDRILLDNMEVPDLREAARLASSAGDDRPVLEASGGITLETVRAVAETGVDLVSVGALTHSAPALDVSLLLEEA